MIAAINGRHSVPADGGAVPVSHALPTSEDFQGSRIVSLYDLMKRFAAGVFPILAEAWTESAKKTGPIPQINKLRLLASFEDIKKEFRTMELPTSKASVQKVLNILGYYEPTWEEVFAVIEEINERLKDETSERQFFTFQGAEHRRYRRPTETWELIVERFPETRTDLEEAWRCWACSRYTAAVFHSLQIIEIGLIDLGTFIGVNNPHSGWSAVANRLDEIIKKKHPHRTDFERDNFPFIEQIQGTVAGLKNAWRNKVSHAHGKLTLMTGAEFHPEVAEDILSATRAFMRRLADGLPKPSELDSPINPETT